jgi:hypothetical protein
MRRMRDAAAFIVTRQRDSIPSRRIIHCQLRASDIEMTSNSAVGSVSCPLKFRVLEPLIGRLGLEHHLSLQQRIIAVSSDWSILQIN